MHDGCIMRGARVVVPEKGQSIMLELLHSSHSVVKMKALARSYVWWPGLDTQIENMARQCFQCEQNAREPTRIPMTPWLFPQRPWSRIHLDYAGPTEGKMILVVLDAYSKWIDTAVVKSANTHTTIEELRKLFSIQGIPRNSRNRQCGMFHKRRVSEFSEKKQCDTVTYTNTGISSIIECIGGTSSFSCESWIETYDKWLNGDQTNSISANIVPVFIT